MRIAHLLMLAVLAIPLGACSSFNIPFFSKGDEQPPDEPAEKLYNEGVYLMNQKSDYKDASRNSRRSSVSTRIPNGRASR